MPIQTDYKLPKQSYQGILIHPDLPTGRGAGKLYIYNKVVLIEVDEVVYTIPFSKLILEAGGASDQFVFFKQEGEKEISIYTKDKSILKDEELLSTSQFKEAISSTKSKINGLYRGVLAIVSICILTVVTLYLFKENIVTSTANSIPVEWEQEMGDQLFSLVEEEYKVLENDSLVNVLSKEMEPLTKQATAEGFRIEYFIAEDPTVNAFALPGGKVVINSGLIKKSNSWDEVSGVLAHEISHVTLRHHVRGMINKVGLFSVVSLFFGDASAVAATLSESAVELQSLSYSRGYEEEADIQGWEYLNDAKMNPEGMITFFKKLEEENEPSKIDSLIAFVSTHPDTQKRINYLEDKLEKQTTREYADYLSDYADFKSAVLIEINQ